MDNPLVIMTTFNRVDLLAKTIESFRKSVSKPSEVLIFDDKSTDKISIPTDFKHQWISADKHLGCNENNLRALRHAFNTGAENVLVLDSDCVFAPDWYSKAMAICQTYDMEKTLVSLCNLDTEGGKPLTVASAINGMTDRPIVGGLGMIVNKKVFALFKDLTQAWDNDLCVLASRAGVRVCTTTPSLVQHTGSRPGRTAIASDFKGEYPRRRMLSMCSSKRPAGLADMIKSWAETVASPDARLVIYVGNDDPNIDAFKKISLPKRVEIEYGPNRNLVQVVNYLSSSRSEFDYYHEINDDHLCRTRGWDETMCSAVDAKNFGYSVAYGKTRNMPTSIMYGGKLLKALGYFFPAEFRHSYIDDWIMNLGQSANLFTYVPEVDIEHMHPSFGLGKSDPIYDAVISDYEYGKKVYEQQLGLMPALVQKIRDMVLLEARSRGVSVGPESAYFGDPFVMNEKYKHLACQLPEGFSPVHPDWNNPGKTAYRQIFQLVYGL